MLYDLDEMESYIRQQAAARGVDPDVAVRVARSEGLARGTWQSNVKKNGIREPSYGPFQMLVGGEGTGYPTGLGNDFMRETGLDPSDPKNAYATVDYALDSAVKGGWGPWYGAKKIGITGKHGIGPNAAPKGLTLNTSMRSRQTPGPAGYDINTPNLPALDPPVEIANRPVFDLGNNIGPSPDMAAPSGVFDRMQQNLAGMGGMGGVNKGLGAIASAFGGGGEDLQAREHATPIQSSLPAMEAADAGRMQAAQQLMSTLMANRAKKRVPGLSLMG